MEITNQVVEIKSINAWTAFKLGLVAYLVVGLLFGLFFGIVVGLAGGIAGLRGIGGMEDLGNTPFSGIIGAGSGFVGGIILGLIWGICYGIAGGIGAAFAALLDDFFAMIVGGIKITLKS